MGGSLVTELIAAFAWFTVLWICLRPVRRSALALAKPEARRTSRIKN
jgi:hypothetical protein